MTMFSAYLLLYLLLFILYLSSLSSAVTNNTRDISARFDCPTWYTPVWNNSEKCLCGDTVSGKIKCLANERVSMVEQNCMTYAGNQTLIGLCSYVPINNSLTLNRIYTTLPQNVSELNEFMCGWNNRTGVLCSQCKSGLSLAALSYKKQCIKCSHYGVALFLFLAFIQATLFFVLVMMCSIDISLGPMNAALCIVQTFISFVNRNPLLFVFRSSNFLSHYLVWVFWGFGILISFAMWFHHSVLVSLLLCFSLLLWSMWLQSIHSYW